jgi:hypothetical protein
MERAESGLFDAGIVDTFGNVLEQTDNAFLVNPSRTVVEDVLADLTVDSEISVRLFVAEAALKTVVSEFVVASTLADLARTDVLSVRLLESVPRYSLLVTDTEVVSFVDYNGDMAGLATEADTFVAETYDEYERRWAAAERYMPQAPPISRIRETLEANLSEAVMTDFDRALARVEDIGDRSPVGEVGVALLVAAKHDALLYDISQWGEEIGLASKATFSRTKNSLEETDLVETEKGANRDRPATAPT